MINATGRAQRYWSARDLETVWTRMRSGTSATLRSPRLDLGPDLHSIVITRPPGVAASAAPILLWSDAARLEGTALARNRREIASRPDETWTSVIQAEALQSDRRQPVQYLFLHLPAGSSIAEAISSIAVVTTSDLAAGHPRPTRIAADGQTRDGYATTAPLSFAIDVPEDAHITFGVRVSSAFGGKLRVTQTVGGTEHLQLETALSAGWMDVRAPLRAAADATITLSTDGPPDAPVVWSVPLLLAPDTRHNAPNVILLVVDALRADILDASAARDAAMPFLDRLAEDCLAFRRAYAAAAWTKPSVATLLTSLYPWTHALGARYYTDALPPDVPTLQGVLAANGYVTAQFSANPFTGAASGLDGGFDTAYMAPALGSDDAFAVPAAALVDGFLRWSAARPRDRYFAYLHVVDAHRAKGLEAYRAAARSVDAEIARLLGAIGAAPEGGNTLVVITADHGEAFDDHGQAGHGQSVYEEELRVPLIVREPGPVSARVVDEPVHLVDLMPTVLDYAGVALDGQLLQGRSLRHTGAKPSPVVVTKFTYPEDIVTSADRLDMHAIVEFPWKLIVFERQGQGRTRELYRLDLDPRERNDLARGEPERTRRLEAALDAFLREQTSARARFASAYQRGLMPRLAPTRELVDQLRSLGYVR